MLFDIYTYRNHIDFLIIYINYKICYNTKIYNRQKQKFKKGEIILKITKKYYISKVFLRFFISFLLILFIPVIVLGFISQNTIQSLLKKQVIENRTYILGQCAARIDYELNNISDIVFKASEENQFSPYIVSDFVKNSLSIMADLKSYRTANTFIHEIYLISDSSEYIFSSGTTYTYDRFIDQKFPEIENQENLLDFLSHTVSSNSMGLYLSEEGTIYLVRDLPSTAPLPYGFMVFEIRPKTLNSFFDISADGDEDILILNDDHIISSSLSSESQKKFMKLYANADNAAKTPFSDEYMVISQISDSAPDITYLLLLPQTQVMKEIHSVIKNFVLYLAIILFWGTLVIFVLAQLNYRPLKRVVRNARDLFGLNMRHKITDEFRDLSEIMKKTHDSLELTQQELELSKASRQYSFLLSLINGTSYSSDELARRMEQTQIHFDGPYLFVVIFHISFSSFQDTIHVVTERIQNYRLEGFSGYAANLYKNNIVGVYSCMKDDSAAVMNSFSSLHQTLEKEFHIVDTLGIGNFKQNISEIPSSFLEATTALDYRFVYGKNNLIFFKNLDLDSYQTIDFPQELTDNLCLAIQSGKKENADTHINELFAYLRSNSCSMYLTKSLCYDIINSILKTVQELKIDCEPLEISNLISLTKFETLEDLEEMLHSFCSSICEYINAGTTGQQPLVNMALHYISHNFSKPDFSVGKMAEDLNVSASYLSRIFKEQQGITIANYIKLYKLNIAKQLLIETDYSLEKIISSLGYYDSSSFIRMFKKAEGITPGEYRKRYQKTNPQK